MPVIQGAITILLFVVILCGLVLVHELYQPRGRERANRRPASRGHDPRTLDHFRVHLQGQICTRHRSLHSSDVVHSIPRDTRKDPNDIGTEGCGSGDRIRPGDILLGRSCTRERSGTSVDR